MPKGFNLRCAAGKTARVWLQGKGGAHTPGQALVLLSIQESGTDDSPITYRAPVPGAESTTTPGTSTSSCAKRTTTRSSEASNICRRRFGRLRCV
jgi:hypothetical protein